MSVAELAKVIGQVGTIRMDHLGRGECGTVGLEWRVPCEVVDVRQVWGRVQYCVRPVGFSGSAVWVETFAVGEVTA